jgi:hypothetical protein
VIRTVALGVVCLAGLGAIAAAAKKSSPPPSPPEVVMPVIAGSKADRLPLVISRDTPTVAGTVDVEYATPSEQDQAPLPQSAPQESASLPYHDITPRRRHDQRHLKTRATKQQFRSTQQTRKRSVDQPPRHLGEVKECRSDGLDPLLRKLNLSPQCES